MTSDNAANIVLGVKESGLRPHIPCFAHTLNLAAKKGISSRGLDRLLGRVRRIVTFFHKSTTANELLQQGIKALELTGGKKLIMDVDTRWNSSFDMLERYLQLEPAVAFALLNKDMRTQASSINTLSDDDRTNIEKACEVLKLLKQMTILLCEAKYPTVSLIIPFKNGILRTMEPKDDDCAFVKDIKSVILENLKPRYQSITPFLLIATAIDPRFLTLPFEFLTDEERDDVFSAMVQDTVTFIQACNDQPEVF